MLNCMMQFQRGLSLPEFLSRCGTADQCIDELQCQRWPADFARPQRSAREPYHIAHGQRAVLQCRGCGRQTSVVAGTVLDSSRLPLRTWLVAMFLICQAKSGLSVLALKRQLGVSYLTTWPQRYKLMAIMAVAAARMPLRGSVDHDGAYLGGEHPVRGGPGSPNKVPFVAAVEVGVQGMPMYAKLLPVPGFTVSAIADWAHDAMLPGTDVLSDGLASFSADIDANRTHTGTVVGQHKPREMPSLKWVNTLLGNLKIALNSAHKHFAFSKYAPADLGAFAHCFDDRVHLRLVLTGLMFDLIWGRHVAVRMI